MTQVLKLVSGTTTTMDLLTGDLRVRVDGWSVQSVSGAGDPVWDTFSLVGKAATGTALADSMYAIQELLVDARDRANNKNRSQSHWLHYKSEGGEEARTLIIDGELSIQSDPGKGGLGPLLNSDGFLYATLAVQHMPWWERSTWSTETKSSISLLGGEWEPTGTTVGDLPSRILEAEFDGVDSIDDLWCGIRPTYGGTAGFIAKWECESGVNGTDAADFADAAASNGTTVRVTFGGTAASTSMLQRLRIGPTNIGGTANEDDWAGKYLVLGRIKCGTATECLIDLYQGFFQAGTAPLGIELVGETKVSNNLYKFAELGQVQFPPFGVRILDDDITQFGPLDTQIYIYAQRLAGTSALYLDALVMMPCEHLLTVKNAGAAAADDVVRFITGPNMESICTRYNESNKRSEIAEYSVVDFTYPQDNGIIVLAGQTTTSSVATATVGMGLLAYPRYSLLRIT